MRSSAVVNRPNRAVDKSPGTVESVTDVGATEAANYDRLHANMRVAEKASDEDREGEE